MIASEQLVVEGHPTVHQDQHRTHSHNNMTTRRRIVGIVCSLIINFLLLTTHMSTFLTTMTRAVSASKTATAFVRPTTSPSKQIRRGSEQILALQVLQATSDRNDQSSSQTITNNQQDQQPPQQQQHLILVGGGHAHIQVIKALNKRVRPEWLRITLIDVQASASYSGMVPGCIANLYTPQETQIELEPLAKYAGMDFVQDCVIDIDFENKRVYTKYRPDEPLTFDAISLDIGSTSRDLYSIPGAQQYTIPTRPIDKLVQRLEQARQDQLCETSTKTPHWVVIGGGAAGLELSMAVTTRWNQDDRLKGKVQCTVLNAGTQLLPDESNAARKQLEHILDDKGIQVIHDCTVQEVTEDVVELQDGRTIPYTHCIWATGAGAHPLAYSLNELRGLDITKHGWIQVTPTLQSLKYPFVFAAGDCASIQNLPKGPPPKAGVYAVRAGPILIENLTRYLDGKSSSEFLSYEPQEDFLKLLVCGDEKALGFRFGLALYGSWVWKLKDHIDRSFMDLFDVSKIKEVKEAGEQPGKYDTSQYDAIDDTEVPPLNTADAAKLLQRQDDGVDYMLAWRTLRAMARNDDYRDSVLTHIHEEQNEKIKELLA